MSGYSGQGGWVGKINTDYYMKNGTANLANGLGRVKLGTFVIALFVNDPDLGLLTRFIFWSGVIDLRVRPDVCVLHHHGMCELYIGGTILPTVIKNALGQNMT